MQYSVKSLLIGVTVFAVVVAGTFVAPDKLAIAFMAALALSVASALSAAALTCFGARRAFVIGALLPVLIGCVSLAGDFYYVTYYWFSDLETEVSANHWGMKVSAWRIYLPSLWAISILTGGVSLLVHQLLTKGGDESP